ncbi:uncharacterized protein CTRU02_203205 [Colletotrichum truncatum]|uniref:Uncharacterized protein n=1 Tax=Colletotrichum truncatum TaxID=5467 RepID=A0ACC3Z8M3_COLTU
MPFVALAKFAFSRLPKNNCFPFQVHVVGSNHSRATLFLANNKEKSYIALMNLILFSELFNCDYLSGERPLIITSSATSDNPSIGIN